MIAGRFPANARLVMKIDIVKPMPPKMPAPKICRHFRSGGKWHRPLATAAKQSKVTPSGLPRTSPAKMPIPFSEVRFCNQSAPIRTPVLASAKIGRVWLF